MTKGAHTKRQKQIRMSDKVRERFESAQHASGMTGEAFVEMLLDLNEGRDTPNLPAELRRLADEIERSRA